MLINKGDQNITKSYCPDSWKQKPVETLRLMRARPRRSRRGRCRTGCRSGRTRTPAPRTSLRARATSASVPCLCMHLSKAHTSAEQIHVSRSTAAILASAYTDKQSTQEQNQARLKV